MNVRTNSKMRQWLATQEFRDHLEVTPLQPVVERLVNSKIIEIQGCFFLEGLLSKGANVNYLLQSDDRTGVESHQNKIHIPLKPRSDEPIELVDILVQGYRYAMRLAERLEEKGHFQVVLSFQDDEFANCSVRFYKVRPGEPWLDDDVEDYKLEALLAIDTIDG